MVLRKNRFFDILTVMATELRLEDRLDGVVNFIPWKARIVLILQESELWEIVNNTVADPVTIPIVATNKAAFDKLDIE